MRVLGIDPGFERLGIAVLEKTTSGKERVLFSECFKTAPSLEFSGRLRRIGEEIEKIINTYKPNMLAMETLFLNTNQKTAMRVAEARGVVLLKAAEAGLKIFEASPPEVKAAVAGDGRADKKQMMKMVKMLLKMEEEKRSDDEMDAIAMALACLAQANRSL